MPDGIQNYLVGSLYKYSFLDMFYAGVLYYLYSVPFLNNIVRGDIAKIGLILIIMLLTLYFLASQWRIHKNYKKHFYYLLMLFLLAILPQFLMSVQPLKVQWILNDSSHRYAFSLYGWIFLSFAFFCLLKSIIAKRNNLLKIGVYFTSSLLLSFSLYNNLKFVGEYDKSLKNWKIIVDSLNKDKEYIEYSRDLLVHPYILPVQDFHVENFILNNFGKKAKFLPSDFYKSSFEDGVDFRINGLPTFIEAVYGLSTPEITGRWSDSNLHPYVDIVFKEKLPENLVLEIYVEPYHSNVNEVLSVSIGESIGQIDFKANGNSMSQYQVPFYGVDSKIIKFKIPNSFSPKSINSNSNDERKIGFRIALIKIHPLN
jgi:hypothetical protein